jgi:Mlc titration factor MtfA (ptsG expression regulator)
VTAVVLVAAAGLAVLAWLLLTPWLDGRRRKRLLATPLPARWREPIERNLPLRARLPAELRARLDQLVHVFVSEQRFVGCNGLTVTDEMRATIAAHACTLLLGRPESHYASLREILVYPTPFWVDEDLHDDDGLVTRRRHMLSGQAWDSSRVIVSWQDVRETIDSPGTGYNVVLHEFAHWFDAAGAGQAHRPTAGTAGLPVVDGAAWHEAWMEEFERLADAVDAGEETLLDPYAAEDEAEFFAVATEEFVERPGELAAAEPRLYALLRAFYGIDPAAWPPAAPAMPADRG